MSLNDIQEDVETLHSKAFDPLGLSTDTTLDSSGAHKMRSGKEEHLYNPQTIHLLQLATRTGDYKTFKEYGMIFFTQETGNRHITGYIRQVTSLNLQAVCVLHSVRKHVHADLMARQYVPKRMKWQSLNMHMPKVMRKQILLR